jgi:16S rRNA (cytosine1402-N4)-methyltransferase
MGEPRGMPAGTHVPVLLERCLQLLAPAFLAAGSTAVGEVGGGRSPVLLDATIGLGGHAEAALAAHSRLRLIGLDRDPQALAYARQRLQRYGTRAQLVHAVFDELGTVLAALGHRRVDGVLFDLGVSSLQLDLPERGFAYAQDAPLDMRMDPERGLSAAEIVNSYPADRLARVLRDYGEERFAARIAAAIVRRRERAPVDSTAQLAELVRDAIPAAARRTGGNPAKRTFQALRIEVNQELDALTAALPAALDALVPGGRIVVLSYHSLEDRITKRAFAERARSSAPVGLPVEPPGTGPTLRLLTRGAERPDAAEVAANPRAASARLRAAERIDPAATPPGAGRAGRGTGAVRGRPARGSWGRQGDDSGRT